MLLELMRTPLDAAADAGRGSLQRRSFFRGIPSQYVSAIPNLSWLEISEGGEGRGRGTPPVSPHLDCRDNDLNRDIPPRRNHRAGVGGSAATIGTLSHRNSAPKVSSLRRRECWTV